MGIKKIADHAVTMVFVVLFKLFLLHTTRLLFSPYKHVSFLDEQQ